MRANSYCRLLWSLMAMLAPIAAGCGPSHEPATSASGPELTQSGSAQAGTSQHTGSSSEDERHESPPRDDTGGDSHAAFATTIAVRPWQATPELTAAFQQLDATPSAGRGELNDDDFAGAWDGIFFEYPYAIQVSLQLQATGRVETAPDNAVPARGSVRGGFGFGGGGRRRQTPPPIDPQSKAIVHGLSGEMSQAAVYPTQFRGQISEGKIAMTGAYDPVSGRFWLAPDAADKNQDRIEPLNITGVRVADDDGQPETLVGTFAPNRYGVSLVALTRPQFAEQRYFQPVRDAKGYLPKGPSEYINTPPVGLPVYQKTGPYDQPGPNNPFYTALVGWMQRISDEYPELDLKRTDLAIVGAKGLNLLEDEHFKKHFGTTYFDLTENESGWMYYPATDDRSPDELWHDRKGVSLYFGRAFSVSGSFGRLENISKLLAFRELRRYKAAKLKQLAEMSPSLDSLEQIAGVEKLTADQLQVLWPSEQREVAQAIEVARRRLAGPSLRLVAADAVRKAQGMEGAQLLAQWPEKHAAGLQWAQPSEREQIQDWVQDKLNSLAAQAAAAKLPELETFGRGRDGLRQMTDWWRQLARDYGMVLQSEPFRQLRAAFDVQRNDAFNRVRPEIETELAAASSIREVDVVVTDYLVLAGDRDCEAGRAIVDFANRRKYEIDESLRLAKFSPRERVWLKEGAPTELFEGPSSEEIRLAILREIAALGGEIIDPYTAHASYPQMRQFGLYMIVRIEKVELVGMPQRTGTGFRCTWRATVRMNYPDDFRKNFGDSPAMTWLELILKTATASASEVTDDFVPTSGGWRSPTAQARRMEGMFGGGL